MAGSVVLYLHKKTGGFGAISFDCSLKVFSI